MTCNQEITQDIANVFGQLTGLGQISKMAHVWQSPFTMHKSLLQAIRREAEHARAGRKAGSSPR